MALESRHLLSDVLAPDDVVVLLDNSVNTVLRSFRTPDPLHTFNFRLLSLRPDDLDNPTRVRDKLASAISAIEAGAFDPMLSRAASTGTGDTSGHRQRAAVLRDEALHSLRHLLEDAHALNALISAGRQAVDATHALGIHPTPDSTLDHVKTFLADDRSPVTSSFDRIFAAERMPFLLFDDANRRVHESLPGFDGCLHPTDGAHIYVPVDFLDRTRSERANGPLAFNQILFDQLLSARLGILSGSELERLPGTDYDKVRYQIGRKRDDVKRHNKFASQQIHMFADEATISRRRLNGGNEWLNVTDCHDPASMVGQVHHLLTYYHDDACRATIRGRFDHAVAFHDAAMRTLENRINARLQETRLPPPTPVAQHEEEQAHPRSPLTAEAVIASADRFVRDNLPSHYRLRTYLQPTPDHRIAIKLTDDVGNPVEKVIATAEPDADRALDIKRRMQAHLLDIPGIAPYRGRMRDGGYNVGLDEFIPTVAPRERIISKSGEYRLRLEWREPHEEMTIPLGLHYSEDNRAEAERRAAFVMQQMADARQETAGRTHLPLTRNDVSEALHNHIRAHRGPWDELVRGQIDQFPASLRFPFAGRGHNQDSWLQVEALRTDGDPNYTWILPLNVIVNGQKLANASTHVNLHVRDRDVAEQRAIETVNRMMRLMSEMPHHARWAIDPEHPRHLQALSEAARNAEPHLLDTNRLTDIQNDLRNPYQNGLRIQVRGTPLESNGQIAFALGIFRGGDHGLTEPVLAKGRGAAAPATVQRRFTIPTTNVDDIERFVQAVNETFRNVSGEEYDPRSSREYDREHIPKRKTPKRFSPYYAPEVLDRAIETHLATFPAIVAFDNQTSRIRARRSGGEELGPQR